MGRLVIYGASDDLVEIEGVVSDELGAPFDKPGIVTVELDDAVWARIRIEYTDDGVWRIGRPAGDAAALSAAVVIPARAEHDEEMSDDEDGCPGYSDKIVIDMGDIEARRLAVSVRTAASGG